MTAPIPQARAEAALHGGCLTVRVGGRWQMAGGRPEWAVVAARAVGPGGERPTRVRLEAADLAEWDSALALFVHDAQSWALGAGAGFESEGFPAGLGELAGLLGRRPAAPESPHVPPASFFAAVGAATLTLGREARDIARLVGDCVYSVMRFASGRAQFRWRDTLGEMQDCGVMALPIVCVTSFLVGVILAYQAAAQLRQFGADLYVADMVGIAMVREMGPLMTAVVLAGRTGAAFAATLGSMKANEEIDAFETLGVSPVDFLVMPRISALFLMLPLLVFFSDALGILGGMAIAVGTLDIPAGLYWGELKAFVDLSDVATGLIKAATYGGLIGLAGCLRGLQAERSADGVGRAATSAVVTSILLLILANAVYAVTFNVLGW